MSANQRSSLLLLGKKSQCPRKRKIACLFGIGRRRVLADADTGVRAYTTPAGKLRRFLARYYNIKAVDHHNEGAHHRWRKRYAVAGETEADRPKRRGLGVKWL